MSPFGVGAVTRKGEEGASGSWQRPISPLGGAYVAVWLCSLCKIMSSYKLRFGHYSINFN